MPQRPPWLLLASLGARLPRGLLTSCGTAGRDGPLGLGYDAASPGRGGSSGTGDRCRRRRRGGRGEGAAGGPPAVGAGVRGVLGAPRQGLCGHTGLVVGGF